MKTCNMAVAEITTARDSSHINLIYKQTLIIIREEGFNVKSKIIHSNRYYQ